MDEVVSQLLSFKTAILMLATVILTFLIRRTVETAFPRVRKAAPETAHAVSYTNAASVWWNQVILYLIPVMLGGCLAIFVKDLGGLDNFPSRPGLALYGGIAGWMSGLMYKVLGKTIKKKTGIDLLPTASLAPPSGGGEEIVIVAKDSKVLVVEGQDPSPPVETLPKGEAPKDGTL